MNTRERFNAVLRYQPYDRMPVVHFGFWEELLAKWQDEGHLKPEEIVDVSDGSLNDLLIGRKLGFDCNAVAAFQDNSGFTSLFPPFENRVIEERADGSYTYFNEDGVIVLQKEGANTIPAEIEHTLVDRSSWEKHYLPRLQYDESRFDADMISKLEADSASRDLPLGLYCKSLFGQIRNWLGIVGVSYLMVDDEALYDEIIATVGELNYRVTARMLETKIQFDFAHFWEDICFKNGSLVIPSVFEEKVGPYYKKITSLLNEHGIDIVSLDCDGVIDALVPIWLANGVNTMFPLEVGTWGGSIEQHRKLYGQELRGIGGMNKYVLSMDYAAVDKEIERLKPLVALGGYIPCPDHRLPIDAKWEVVQYYCDQMREAF